MLPLNKIIVNALTKASQNILNTYTLTQMDYRFKKTVKNLIQYSKKFISLIEKYLGKIHASLMNFK